MAHNIINEKRRQVDRSRHRLVHAATIEVAGKEDFESELLDPLGDARRIGDRIAQRHDFAITRIADHQGESLCLEADALSRKNFQRLVLRRRR